MPRRDWQPITFHSLADLNSELDACEAAHRAGTLRTTGNWSAGQIFEHLANPMRMAFDGFGTVSVPFPVRMAGTLVFKPLLGRSRMRPGIKLPKKARPMLPRDQVPFEEGLVALRKQMARIETGEKMTHPSPVLGRMTHDQWVLLHLDHCRMHMGFIRKA